MTSRRSRNVRPWAETSLAATSELSPEMRAAALSKLDLVEDVLDAVLLTGRGQRDEAEKEREPP